MNTPAMPSKKSFISSGQGLPAIVLTGALLGIISYAAHETAPLFTESIATVIALVSTFWFLFGRSSIVFDIVFANAITLYLCLFAFFIDSVFSQMPPAKISIGFLMPVVAFFLGVLYRRQSIREIVSAKTYIRAGDFFRAFAWLMPIIVIGVLVLVIHQPESLPKDVHEVLFLLEMGVISGIAFLASRDLVLMMMDTSLLFSNFFSDNARLIKPVFAFFTFYSLSIIIFAAFYRIIDLQSATYHFQVFDAGRDITFVESMYFSFVTASTLGYGDILPITNAMRFLVSIQGLFSIILFFFGIHAILSHDEVRKKS